MIHRAAAADHWLVPIIGKFSPESI